MKLALFGYGGHAKEVACQIGGDFTFFVDDKYSNNMVKPISEFNHEEYSIMIAVSNPVMREEVVNKLHIDTDFFTFIHPTAQIMGDNVNIGEGSFIGANCILTEDINLGDHSILNRGVHIGHDSNLDNYFTSMPNSVVSGNVNFGKYGYMGTNSTVIEKITITNNVTIGAGGVVVKNITNSGVYVGVPTKQIK
ncbi:acetyltransferase [bacterium]|jgi:sugar O-acyltransferase (sialic acid O-acetyltransferase NeuD family)|nr:acetyltransferase [bacterium]|tara:strand:- start:3659 stop:4237 length:579 start_codon:yes stop_codon:yes gene_type:complete